MFFSGISQFDLIKKCEWRRYTHLEKQPACLTVMRYAEMAEWAFQGLPFNKLFCNNR